MSTDEKPQFSQQMRITFERIWNNLKFTDKEENPFPFSKCRNRQIVVLGSKKTPNYIVSELIQHHNYYDPQCSLSNKEQNTITYVTVADDPSCNVCIMNLIDILPLEKYIKRTEKTRKDQIPSPMPEVDKAINQFASKIDLIVLVCDVNDLELMKNMKRWAPDRERIMALALIVEPTLGLEERKEWIHSTLNNQEFRATDLNEYFKKGIFCISDLSSNRFKMQLNASMQNNSFTNGARNFYACVSVVQTIDRMPSTSIQTNNPTIPIIVLSFNNRLGMKLFSLSIYSSK